MPWDARFYCIALIQWLYHSRTSRDYWIWTLTIWCLYVCVRILASNALNLLNSTAFTNSQCINPHSKCKTGVFVCVCVRVCVCCSPQLLLPADRKSMSCCAIDSLHVCVKGGCQHTFFIRQMWSFHRDFSIFYVFGIFKSLHCMFIWNV